MQANHSDGACSGELVEKSLGIGLSAIHGIGSQIFFQLLKTFRNPSNIFAASNSQLNEVVSDQIAAEITKGIYHDALSD